MKTHITFEVDTNELFDTLQKMNGNTAPIGERIVGVMLADDAFFNKGGMAVYGVTVIERKPADAAPASAEPVAWTNAQSLKVLNEHWPMVTGLIASAEGTPTENVPLYAGPEVAP